jgi:hypothetical protein
MNHIQSLSLQIIGIDIAVMYQLCIVDNNFLLGETA